MDYRDLKTRLTAGKVVLMDGGIGTEILRRGYTWASHQIETEPELILDIHKDYIRAGAAVITTNTFQLTRRSFRNHFANEEHMLAIGEEGLLDQARKSIAEAVGLAKLARKQTRRKEVIIAASITTLEWCFRPDLTPDLGKAADEYLEELTDYADAGADIFLFETFNSTPEARVALQAARQIGKPAWLSFVPDRNGALLGGETMEEAVDQLGEYEPDVLMLNCAPPPHVTVGLQKLSDLWDGPLGVYAHVGRFDPPEWLFTDEYPPEKYLEECLRWRDMGVAVIGGCCGTTPEHIALLAKTFKS